MDTFEREMDLIECKKDKFRPNPTLTLLHATLDLLKDHDSDITLKYSENEKFEDQYIDMIKEIVTSVNKENTVDWKCFRTDLKQKITELSLNNGDVNARDGSKETSNWSRFPKDPELPVWSGAL